MRKIYLFLIFFFSLVLDATAQKTYTLEVPGSDLPIQMVPIAGGSYSMGSPESEQGRKSDEGPQHKVSLDGFWMGKHEVTWEQYEAFLYRDGSENFKESSTLDKLGIDGVSSATTPYIEMSFGMGKEGYPAVNITHYAALMYCKWLTAVTGDFYRLPTEAEWEYVCKTGKSQAYTFGNSPDQLNEFAIYDAEKYEKVGSLKANEWGIHDIHGNVSEWTMDQYDANSYKSSKSDNPWVKPETLYPRVARGGSWKRNAEASRCSARLASNPNWKMRDPQLPKSRWWLTNAPWVGFRVVRPFEQPTKKEIEKFWLEAMDDYGN